MAIQPAQRPTFFELFRTRCRNTEVGPTSLNWFEELTSEALPYEPKNSEELDSKNDWFDKNTFKTPNHRVPAYSQLASTPIIFKEQALRSPTFSSPVKERAQCTSLVQKPGVVTNEWSKSPYSNQMKPDLSKEVISSPRNTALHESPAVVREMFRTPRRIMKCTHQTPLREQNVCGSLFCTPKLLRDQTAKCISESLGVEVDPEMSWSSSLATPPTLTSTVIIAKGNDQLSGPPHLEDSTDIIVHRLLTKCNKGDGKPAAPSMCHSVKESLTFENDAKFHVATKQNMATILEEAHACENKMPVITTSGWKQTIPNALEEGEVRKTVENVLDGMEDVLSVFFTSGKPSGLRKVKTVNGVRRKQIEKSGSIVGQPGELAGCINSDICLQRMETHFDSSTCCVSVENKSTVKKHDETIRDRATQEDIPCSSASQWSKLNLSGLNVTQLVEMSYYTPSAVDLPSMKDIEERFAEAKEYTVNSNLEVSSEVDCLPQVKRELNFNLSEHIKNDSTMPELQLAVPICRESIHGISSPDDVFERSPSPTFPKSQTPRPISSVKFIESTSLCLQKKSLGNDTGVLESRFHGDLPGDCTSTKCDQCADSIPFPCLDSPTRAAEPQMKSKGILSRLKKQPKKFIYSIHDNSVQKKQKDTTNLRSESSMCALSTSEHKTFSANDDDEGAKTSRFDTASEKKICCKIDIETNQINEIFYKNNDEEITSEITVKEAASLQTAAKLGLSPVSEQKQSMKTTNRNDSSIKRKALAAAALLAAKRSRIEPSNVDNTVEFAKNPNLVSGCSKDSELDCQRDHFEEPFSVEMCSGSVEFINTIENCDSNLMLIQDRKNEETTCQIVSADENCISELALKQLMMVPGTNCALCHLPSPTQKAKCGCSLPKKEKDLYLNLHSLGAVQQPKCIAAEGASNAVSFQNASKKTIAICSENIENVQKLFDNTECSFSNEVISPAPPISKPNSKEKPEQTVFNVIPNDVPTWFLPHAPSGAGFVPCKNITKSQLPSTERLLEKLGRSTESFSNHAIEIKQLGGTDSHGTPVSFASTFKVSVGDFKTASDRPIQISMDNATKGKRLFKEIEDQFCTENQENLTSLGNSLFLSVCNKISTDMPSVEFKTVMSNQLNISKNELKKGRQLSEEFVNCSTGLKCENVDIKADTKVLPDSQSDSTKQPGISENILKGNLFFQEIGEHNTADKLNENKDIKPDVKVLSAFGENVHLSEYHDHTGSQNVNVNTLGESYLLPNFNPSVLNDHTSEFKTTLEKKMHISENNIEESKMTFQGIEDHCLSGKVHTEDTIHDLLILPFVDELGPNQVLITSESATKIQIPVTQKEFDRSRMHVHENKTCFSTGEISVSVGGFKTVCHELKHNSENKRKKDEILVKKIEEQYLNENISTNDSEMDYIGSSSKFPSCLSKTDSFMQIQTCRYLTKKHILLNKFENQCITEVSKNTDFVKTSNIFPVLNETNKNVSFCGFKTASNKWIQFSENQVENGKMIFKELEDNFQNTLGQHAEENISVLSVQQTLATSPPRESAINELCVLGIGEPKDLALINTQCSYDTRHIIQKISTRSLSQPSQSLTESQKADITELSHMLEENYSQFEFTQLKKTSNAITSDTKALSMTACEMTQLNNSDMWKDVDFNDSFDTEVQLVDTTQPSGMPNLNKSSAMNHSVKDEAVDLGYKTFVHPQVNVEDVSVLASLHAVPEDSLTGSKSFRLATGKKIGFDHDVTLSAGKLSSDTLGAGEEIECIERNLKKHAHTRTDKATCEFQPGNHCDSFKRKSYSCVKLNENISKSNMNNCERIITEDQHKHSTNNSGCVSSIRNEYIDENVRQSENGDSSKGELHNYDLQPGSAQNSVQLKKVSTFETVNAFYCSSDGSWSHELLDKEVNKYSNYVPGGFQTAGGRNILVSKKSLDKAHILLQEECSSPLLVDKSLLEDGIHRRDTGLIKSTSVLQNTVVQETEFSDLKNTVITIDPRTSNMKLPERSMKGIHTSSEKKILVTDSSLTNIKHICLEDTSLVDMKHEVNVSLNKIEKSEPLVTINDILEGSLPEKYYSDTTFKCNDSRKQPTHVKYVSTLEQHMEVPTKEPLKRDINVRNPLELEVSNPLYSVSENSDIHCIEKSPMCPSNSSEEFSTVQGKLTRFSKSALQTGKDLFVRSDFAGIAQNDVSKNVLGFALNKSVKVAKGQDVLVEDPIGITDLNTKEGEFNKIMNVGEIIENLDSKQVYRLNNFNDSNTNASDVKAEYSTILHEQKMKSIIIGDKSHSNSKDTCQTTQRFDEQIETNRQDTPVTNDNSYSEINLKGKQSINSGEGKIKHLKGIAFTTAAGKKVSVSDESLKKAKQLFQEVCNSDECILPKITSMSLVNQVEVPAPCSQAPAAQSIMLSKNVPSETKLTRKQNDYPFSVNKGKEVDVQTNDLKNVRMTCADMGTENKLQTYGGKTTDNYVPNCYDDSGPSYNSLDKTGPFSTASGKPVQHSEKSLKKAKQLFLEIESSSPVNDKDMLTLKSSCKKDTTMNAENDSGFNINSMPVEEKDSRSSIGCPLPIVEGKQVCLQEKSIKHVRMAFADKGTENKLQTSGGQAGDSYVSKCQDKSTYKVNTSLEQTGFFSTASGKPVQLSEESLKKGKQMFLEIESRLPAYDKGEFNLKFPNKDDDKLVNANKDNMFITNPTPIEEKHTRSSIEFPFSNAKGKQVGVLEKALKHVKQTFSDMETKNSDQSSAFSIADNRVVKCQDKSTCIGNFAGGFNTASGKAVQLSEDSLRKARQLFMEIEIENNNSKPDNKDIFTMQSQCKEVNPMFARKDIAFNTNVKQTTPQDSADSKKLVHLKANCGFNTASGKQVLVSEDTLEKVKSMLKEFDHLSSIVYDSFSEGPQPAPPKETYMCSLPQREELSVKKRAASPLQKIQVEKSIQNSSKTVHSSEMHDRFLQSEERIPTALQRNLLHYNKSTVHSHPHCKAENTTENLNAPFASFVRAPENFQDKEAMESAIAFMEDGELTENSVIYAEEICSTEEENKQNGKRLRTEEGFLFGEPPIKRRLLPEFDRTMEAKRSSSFKAMTSTPDDASRDRRKFSYNVALKPISCRPPSGKKERREAKIPSITVPDQDLKGFHCRTTIFQNRLLNFPENDPSVASSPSKMTPVKECEKTKSVQAPSKQVKTFIPPFKTKSKFPSGDKSGEAKSDISSKENVSTGDEQIKYQNEETVDSIEPLKEKESVKTTITLEDRQFNEQGLREMIENLHCARDMQAMRIRKKQRQRIRPQPGSLYTAKTSTSERYSLKAAVEGKCPFSYSLEQLHMFGVLKNSIGINSENAESFQFDCLDHFSKDLLFAGHGIQIADGGWIIPTDNHKAGKEELYRALCDTPGVDPKLISEAWANNHYRWIVWKLAAMEVSFPEKFASCCLTPERVLLQLKYRYDVEVDKSQRSAVKKIMERDDTAAKTLILCFSQVISMGTSLFSPNGSKPNMSDGNKSLTVIEVTDGWYGIKALLDPPLSTLVNRKRLAVGSKIIVHGAELIGSDEACTPLEAPESLMLKISANSTRLARWDAVLGFYQDPRPFPLSLSSLFSDGGLVGCIDVIIERVYPLQWMEKMPNGMYVFRNDRAEEREAEKHSAKQQKNLEALFGKIQAEFEQSEAKAKSKISRRTLTRKQIHAMQDGAELYEAIQNESDPGYLEACLSNEQLRALNNHRQTLNDRKQAEIQAEFRKAIESDEQGQNGCGKRDITSIWKVRIVDYKNQEKDAAFILSIWRPLSDVRSLLKEGGRYRMYHLSTSHSKGKSDASDVQLTATKKTQYQQLQPSQEILASIFSPRRAIPFSELLDPSFCAPCAEVDVVGYVISISRKAGSPPYAYLSDENHNLIAVKFWTDLCLLALEDVIKPYTLIAASNLQLRSNCELSIPTLFAGELSLISANPKDGYLQEEISKLRYTVQNIKIFCNDAEKMLVNVLQTSRQDGLKSTMHSLDADGPTWKPGVGPNKKFQTPSDDKTQLLRASLSMFTPERKLPVTPVSASITPQVSGRDKNELDSCKDSKKKKAINFLCRIPSPPPVSPGQAMVSPSLQKAFRPPRSSGPPYSSMIRGKDCKSTGARSLQKCNTNSKPEEGWVADEELAMINTQALLCGMDEEKKMCILGENSNDLLSDAEIKKDCHQSVIGIGTDAVIDVRQETEDDEKKLNVTQPVSYQRKLKRRKRKCY
ncbi:breast cancer type 2 susceptibility protein isoform X2 [Lissotriton helveticus]